MKRLLVISRACLARNPQLKFEWIKKNLNSSEKMLILVPDAIATSFRGNISLFSNSSLSENIIQIKSYFNSMILFFNIFKYIRVIKTFKPTLLLIEEDPHSILGFQSVVLNKIFNKNTKIIFFIWDNINRKPSFPINFLKKILTFISFKLTDCVIVGNKKGYFLLKNEKNFLKKSFILPQVGVDISSNEKKKLYFKKKRDFVYIGYAGRIVEEKGVDDIVNAISLLKKKKVILVLIGNGPLIKTHLNNWNCILNNNVIYIPTLPQSEMYNLLNQIDIFVLASRSTKFWVEQFGHVLAQGMAAGCLCIGSDSGAIPEVLNDKDLIYPEGNFKSLSRLMKIYIDDIDLRKTKIKHLKQYANKNYFHKALALKYLEIFRLVDK